MAYNKTIKNIFLTGRHKIGKSHLIHRILENFPLASIGGFLTEPVYNSESRADSYQLRYYNQAVPGWVFASKSWYFFPQYAHFGVDYTIFDVYGKLILEDALQNHQIIVMDELGFMEENAFIFQEKVFQCLDAEVLVFGVIKPVSNNFLQKIRERSDVVIIELTPDNQENIYQILVDDIQRLLKVRI